MITHSQIKDGIWSSVRVVRRFFHVDFSTLIRWSTMMFLFSDSSSQIAVHRLGLLGVIAVDSMRQRLIWGETIIARTARVHKRVTWNKACTTARLGGGMKLHPLLHQLNWNQSHLLVPRYGDCTLSKAITLNRIMDRSFPVRPKAWLSKSDQLVQTHGREYEHVYWGVCKWSKEGSFYSCWLSSKGQEAPSTAAQCDTHQQSLFTSLVRVKAVLSYSSHPGMPRSKLKMTTQVCG